MAIKYMLIAQMEGDEKSMYVARNPSLNISHVRHERPLIVVRQERRDASKGIEKDLSVQIGGFLGLNTSPSVSHIAVDND